jgi:hypothetical protein
VSGSFVQWTVSAGTAGSATLSFRFANGTTANRPMDITVNGTQPPPLGSMAAAPYEYFGWGNPQRPTDVMAATGVWWFTLP